ncbi:hypothetical protein TcYC6_0110690 [Trypanosoma cruzi]|uniref:Uncharacterized protein n=2 Tax=Trypanosoma cruzi TaxID=5693 RepID=Q4CXY3_TRYCC|nr:hypothetical protein Tc00.1047053510325.20 [Trypanosoma cruzi]EAN85131.1 hypothetical protein Tc00.1047053510325.20 [Trypanosoma cruzi]KAF5225116.1 hypothetical protein ECC02_001661 [Trypanosoma cruzi]KAF8293321.1 hypothetical protein TcYC6_0110690 [Trypanosoma cruzi]|eukprot:XP_806982.1 hypothetical protein [Trypanosoma cruzi strain CL Brener]
MAIAMNDAKAYVLYFTEGGQQMLLPVCPGTSAGMPPSAASQGTPFVWLPFQDATELQHQRPAFVATKSGAGAPLMAVPTNYILPWAQAKQPIGASYLTPGPNGSALPVVPISPNTNLQNAHENYQQSSVEKGVKSLFPDAKNSRGARTGDEEKSANRFQEILSVRNFTSPVGSVLVRGRKMSMNVPPLAKRRPPLCRNPPGASSSAVNSNTPINP